MIDELIKSRELDLTNQDVIDHITRKVMDLPQVDCPVAHYFGDRIYIREVSFPAGIFAIGHKQRYENMNIFIRGKVGMIMPDGTINKISAPMTFKAPAGQKMGIIIKNTIWQNVYPNPENEKDIDKLESYWLDKEGPWTEKEEINKIKCREAAQDDRDDFKNLGFDITYYDYIRINFNNILFPRNSNIDGKGLFTSWSFRCGSILGPYNIDDQPTEFAKYINHSKDPNCKIINDQIVAIKDIKGCQGGSQGEEITIDYRDMKP